MKNPSSPKSMKVAKTSPKPDSRTVADEKILQPDSQQSQANAEVQGTSAQNNTVPTPSAEQHVAQALNHPPIADLSIAGHQKENAPKGSGQNKIRTNKSPSVSADKPHYVPMPSRNYSGRQNYSKYELLKDEMLDLLRSGELTSKEMAEKLKLSYPGTYFKYEALLQHEYRNVPMTLDESMYLKNRKQIYDDEI
jgi:hypothetical protein